MAKGLRAALRGSGSVSLAETEPVARAEGGLQPDSVVLEAEMLTAAEWGLPSDEEQDVEGQELGG